MQDVRKKTFMNNPLLFLVILMVARFSCIMLSNIPLMSMGYMFVYGVLFVILFVISVRYLGKRELVALMFLTIYVLYVVFITVGVEGLFNTQAFNAYIIFFLYFIYLFLKHIGRRKAYAVYLITITGFLFTYIYSIVKLIEDPLLSRKAASAVSVEESVDVLGAIGGFDTVYGSILVVCILLFMRKNSNKVGLKILAIVTFISSCFFLVMSSYGTALVLLVLLFGLWIFQKSRLMGFVMIVISLFLFIFHKHIGLLISEFSQYITYSDMLKQKVDEIGRILSTGQSAGTLAGEEGRLARMEWSWNAFLTYPILGGFGKSDVQIGYHSELFDTLGRFGLIGAVSLFTFLGLLFKDIYSGMKTWEGKKCCLICLTLYVAIVLLNPALYTQQLLPIFVLLPLYERIETGEDSKRV